MTSFTISKFDMKTIDDKYMLHTIQKDILEDKTTTTINNVDTVFPKFDRNIYVFRDDLVHNCKISYSKLDRSSEDAMCCHWCKNPIPENVLPIGIPISYVPPNIHKTYQSSVSDNVYSITEDLSEVQYISMKNRKTNIKQGEGVRITINDNSYYITDGVVDNFSCAIALINDNKHNPEYVLSKSLLYRMYKHIYGKEIVEIRGVKGKDEAIKAIRKSIELYDEKYGDK